MKKLVKGQKIRIDNHHKGTRGVDYYDDTANDIHFDKTVYDKKKKNGEYQIRVPLNSDRPVTVNCDENCNIPKKLLKEIQDAFKDKEKRENFIKEVRDILNGYPIRDRHFTDVDRAREAMKRISNAFDLGWDDAKVLSYVHMTKTQGLTFISLLPRNEITYYVTININKIVVADYDKIPHRYNDEWEEIKVMQDER